ncbi:DNA-processing protein DprA [Microbacterium sp. No. 7]|uniref:DNA-processing protein DprA n=1 Tax=Microbacterium sp. No. 7 TaxID=1714373 RepID=UPI0006CF711D|nr:DNA-processing protein DprA [Microbacterium sp. No. 7]ALJ20309.1 DNA-binding protein [Microbacterium sp. No. 7]
MSAFDLSPDDARAAVDGLTDADVDPAEVVARAAWSALAEPGDGVAGLLVGRLGAAAALRAALTDRIPALDELDPRDGVAARARWMPRAADAAEALRAGRRAGARIVVPGDPLWPARADDLGPHAPLCLWTVGDPAVLSAPAVAIVGARAATAYGEHVAMELGAELAARGLTVISGGAYGIDGAAHRAALGAGGATAALMAGGVDRLYPQGHLSLFSRIVEAGVVASELPCGSAPTKWRFLSRNRLIAALSDATIVVEAGARSGSINTAHHAATIGRPLGAVPGPVTSATSAGCHRLMREAGAVCVTSADDVRDLMGLLDDGALIPVEACTAGGVRVLDALSARVARLPEDIARRSGLSVDETTAVLGVLELDGRAQRLAHGWKRAG